jgi:uncharacterized coiled-coil DUF342 family protein
LITYRGRLLSEKEKTVQVTNINLQIDRIRKQITDGNEQIKKDIEKRNQLHEQVKNIRDEINKKKIERDELNEKVKSLKQQRDAIRTQVTPILDEIKLIKEKIDELKKHLPRISQHELQREHEAIEWKISTTSLDLQDEKRLIEKVKAIEIQLSGYKKIDHQNKKIKDLYKQKKVFDSQADVFHKELTEFAKKSQDLHTQIMEQAAIMRREKIEADALHQNFIKTKEQNNQLYEQIKLLVNQSIGLRSEIKEQYDIRQIEYLARRQKEDLRRKEEDAKRKEEQAQRAIKEQAIKEKIGSEAREKLQRGEKVSWDEYQLMLGDDKEDDSETQA